jgi:hypothetical protein
MEIANPGSIKGECSEKTKNVGGFQQLGKPINNKERKFYILLTVHHVMILRK